MSLLWLLLAVAHTDGGAITWQTRAPRTTNGLYTSADDDASARTSSSMPTRCPQSHESRVGGLANRTSTTAAQVSRLEPWTLVPATNAPSRPHAPNAMRGRLNPRTRAASHLTSSRKQATDVRSRVGGHVDDPSPTAVHIRCYDTITTENYEHFCFCSIGSGEPRAWPQSHGARVDGRAPHVSDSSPTVVHIQLAVRI